MTRLVAPGRSERQDHNQLGRGDERGGTGTQPGPRNPSALSRRGRRRRGLVSGGRGGRDGPGGQAMVYGNLSLLGRLQSGGKATTY